MRPRAPAHFGFVLAWWGASLALARTTRAEEPAGKDEVTVHGDQARGFESKASVDDAPREVTDAASLVEALPGVHVRRLGADDSFATLSIRGSTSSEVAVVLAGVPLTGGADPTLDLATLPLWPGAKARVYRSFAPASLGPGSLGGTLAIDPPSARAAERTEVWGAVGSFGAARMRVADVRALDDAKKTRLVTALSASRADDAFTFYDPLTNAEATRRNGQHAAVNGLVSLVLPVAMPGGEDGSLTMTSLVQSRRQHLPGTVFGPTPLAVLDSNRELASIELSLPSGPGAWIARGWGRRDDLRLRDPETGAAASLGPVHTNDAIVASGGALGWRGRFDRASLEARVDGSGEWYAPGSWQGAAQPASATRAMGGAGVDAEWRASRALTLSATGRADAWSDSSDDAAIATHGDARPTGHLGAELRAGSLAFAAHGGAVARPPSFVERFGDRGAFLGNADLLPESAWTADAGVRTLSWRSGEWRARAELDAFATWADDLIVFVAQGAYGRARATNIGRARLLGTEAELDVGAYGAELRASYTGLATANEAACVAASGSIASAATCDRPALPGRPAHDFTGDLSYRLGPVTLRYGVDVVTGISADLVGDVVVPPRALQSAGARLDVPGVRGLRVAVEARNLFDVRTATYDGAFGAVREPIGDVYDYPLPGRSVLATARWLFDRE